MTIIQHTIIKYSEKIKCNFLQVNYNYTPDDGRLGRNTLYSILFKWNNELWNMVFVLFQYMRVTMGCISWSLKENKVFYLHLKVYLGDLRLQIVKWQREQWISNWKVCGRKRLRTNFGYYLILLYKTCKTKKKSYSRDNRQPRWDPKRAIPKGKSEALPNLPPSWVRKSTLNKRKLFHMCTRIRHTHFKVYTL